ncbi:hypothetical protein HDE_10929 [Halotydeus destructor]|nr:hypothetical protein HDE_10929 [Halotydeus destructor]
MSCVDVTTSIYEATRLMSKQEYNESEALFQSCLRSASAHDSNVIITKLRELRELVLCELGFDSTVRKFISSLSDTIAEAVKMATDGQAYAVKWASDGQAETTEEASLQSKNEEDDFECKVFHPASQLKHGLTNVRSGHGRRMDFGDYYDMNDHDSPLEAFLLMQDYSELSEPLIEFDDCYEPPDWTDYQNEYYDSGDEEPFCDYY